MISSWRRRRAGRRAAKKHGEDNVEDSLNMEFTIPNHFRCPISLDLMKDPVTLSTGITYDRESIETWMEAGNDTCPITKQALASAEPIPNHTIRKMIQDWCVENRSYGIERIPTPRIPVTPFGVSQLLSKITTAQHRHDGDACRELVVKIKHLAKESERNKRCITSNGTAMVLAIAFEVFSSSFDSNVSTLEEILSTLSNMYPLEEEAKTHLASTSSLQTIVWFLRCGDLSSRRNAALALKELLLTDQQVIHALSKIDGAMDALVKLVKEPICPTSTKASLLSMFYMISSSPSQEKHMVISRLVELGLVSILLEIIVDTDKSICEKSLAVLDGICGSEKGREKAYEHALTVPVLVKKMLRVSDLATEFLVSILWKMVKNEKREEGSGVVVQVLQVGAFQKLLLLLQVGCSERTKEKVTELLKLLNVHRGVLECIDSMDFKNLKRPI